ncbi:F-box protein [Escovopsis weberi]|uniref:F-box protein n=1 Tax=Escovopsis weberi TaxID=150374 RepID=A0A0M8N5Y9_ESCWE|nr:F-box protein [Escovopsis weberi]
MVAIDTHLARRPSFADSCASPVFPGTGVAPRALSPTFDPLARSSFSSVREIDDGLVQTFTRSKISSYTEALEEEAIVDGADDSPTAGSPVQAVYQPPVTQPNSRLHRFLYPADTFQGWREIPLSGKRASRSCDNLQRLHMTWDTTPAASPLRRKLSGASAPGLSPLELLPNEVLGSIIDLLVVEIPPNGLTTRNADLMSLLLTSKSLHGATLTTLYRHITIPHSRIFRKFLSTVSQYPALATIVRRLDFSHFNPSMLFISATERAKTKNLTSETLLQCLELTPYLQEFLAQEYIDEDLNADVLAKLFFDSPQLQALDFCGCSSLTFKKNWEMLLEQPWPEMLTITRLSFHKCMSLPAAVFERMLPKLPRLTHLDVAATRMTNRALLSIPETARLTHLNLAKCRGVSSEAVIRFISTHPAAQSLVYLSLATDPSSHLLLGKADVSALLPKLPPSLRSLSLKGSRMDSSHISELRRLSQSLEELTVGRGLSLSDVNSLLYHGKEVLPHNLKYLDITDTNSLISSGSELLAPATYPLRVIEIEERAFERTSKVAKNLERVGWKTQEFGSRYWLVRMKSDGSIRDHDTRWWKHGAESWGMNKIPVANAEVGGMYGSFMFGRRL